MKTAEDIICANKRHLVTASPETTITEAVIRMREEKIGAILVEKDSEIIGIWTERDLMKEILKPNFDPSIITIESGMTSKLQVGEATDTVCKLMDKFLGLRLRHLLIKKNDKYIGLLSAGDVMKATMLEKNHELAALNAKHGWEYYEEWK